MTLPGKGSWIASAAVLLLIPAAARPADDPAASAAARLERRGLVKITGRVWGLPLEVQLRDRLRGLPELRERIVTAHRELDERVASNAAAWKAATTAMAALDQQLAQLPPGDPQRPLLASERKRIAASAVPPAELAGHDAVRPKLAQLAQDRCSLSIDLAWIRGAVETTSQRYRALAADGELSPLLLAAGDQCRLGPARNYRAELRGLEDYDKLAGASQVPIFLQSGRVRVTAVVGDATCTTVTWSEASDAVSYLPSSVLLAAGMEIPPDAPLETLRIGERSLACRQVFLPSLRLGSVHAKSVAALALPPEAEDLGGQLTPLALSPHRARLDRERLRLVIE